MTTAFGLQDATLNVGGLAGCPGTPAAPSWDTWGVTDKKPVVSTPIPGPLPRHSLPGLEYTSAPKPPKSAPTPRGSVARASKAQDYSSAATTVSPKVGPLKPVSKAMMKRCGSDICSVGDVRTTFARRMRRRRDESLQSQPADADPVEVEVQQELPRFTCKCGQTYVLTVASF